MGARGSTLGERLASFPRLGLAQLPTALEPMKRLTAHLGGPQLWVKREDATGLGFGGNKLRKLDYVLHQVLSSGADTIVSGGVVQSNSQRQVAAVAAKLGLNCHLAVYHGRLEPPTPEYKTSGNAFLNRLFGAHLHDVAWTGDRNASIRALVSDLEARGRKPYFVPYGVSNALGAIAYATMICELDAQATQLGFAPSAIVHCTGSAGTQAGLVVGASLAMPNTRIVGIDIVPNPSECALMSWRLHAKRPTCSIFRSSKRPLKSLQGTPGQPTASHIGPRSKQSDWRANSKPCHSIQSIPAKGLQV
jgi:L-cysteate sulfo-lyase